MAASTGPAITVESLTKRYGDMWAVNDISFTVGRGEVFALLGPNGAGKTTTVEIITTIRKLTSGQVTVLDMDVATRKRDIIPHIGVLPQAFSSFDRITVRESIQYYARLFGCRDTDVNGLMTLANLHDKRDVQFRNLSGGMKQRLGIAIALVNDPQVVFLDEPTAGLDPLARRAVWEVLLGLKSRGKTVFLTTHYMEEAELLADFVAIVSKGKLVTIGSPEQLIERHADYVSLTLKSLDATVTGTIRKMGYTPIQEKHHIRIQVKRSDDVLAILGALQSAGVPLPNMDVRKPNLEEVFLSLTGEALHEADPSEGSGK